MKNDLKNNLIINDLYVCLQIEQSYQTGEVIISLKLLEKTPYFIEGNEKIQIYNDPSTKKHYYLMQDDTYFVPMNSNHSDAYIYFKHLKSLNDIFNKCYLKLKNCSNLTVHDLLSYKLSIKKLNDLQYLNSNNLFNVEEMIYDLYCFAYNNIVNKEMENNDDFYPPKPKKKRKKNPKEEK